MSDCSMKLQFNKNKTGLDCCRSPRKKRICRFDGSTFYSGSDLHILKQEEQRGNEIIPESKKIQLLTSV